MSRACTLPLGMVRGSFDKAMYGVGSVSKLRTDLGRSARQGVFSDGKTTLVVGDGYGKGR